MLLVSFLVSNSGMHLTSLRVEKYTEVADRSTLPKILQFSSEDRITKYEICQLLADVAGLPLGHMVPNDSHDPNSTGLPLPNQLHKYCLIQEYQLFDHSTATSPPKR